jgi:tetratricopeptide (TPR) repeat protein
MLLAEGDVGFANADPYTEGSYRAVAATYLALLGRDEEANAAAERAIELARTLHNRNGLVAALSASSWALQRVDPHAALARLDELFQLAEETPWYVGPEGTALALAGGLHARLGDTSAALALLYRAALVTRDEGVRPQFAGMLDWSVLAFVRTGRPDIAVVLLGVLTDGALADVSNYLLTGGYSRDQALDRIRPMVGEAFAALVARGAAMSYDEVVDYALEQLRAASA